MTAGTGIGSTTIGLEKVQAQESSFAFELEAEVTAKAKAGGVMASVGFSYGYETSTSVSNGTYREGEVPAIPTDSYNDIKDFDWGLMAHPKRDPKQNYVFVTYWTRLH